MFDQATDRLSKELDIVNFLKHQMIDKIQRKTLFTQADRYLMKHQAPPFVLTPRHSQSSDTSDFQFVSNIQSSPFQQTLLQGIVIHHRSKQQDERTTDVELVTK